MFRGGEKVVVYMWLALRNLTFTKVLSGNRETIRLTNTEPKTGYLGHVIPVKDLCYCTERTIQSAFKFSMLV